MKEKHKGAHSELRAAAWLLEQGYEVFRNVSACGEIDIVAIKDGVTRFFDVKSSYRARRAAIPNIEYLCVVSGGGFKVRAPSKPRITTREATPREIILQKLADAKFDEICKSPHVRQDATIA